MCLDDYFDQFMKKMFSLGMVFIQLHVQPKDRTGVDDKAGVKEIIGSTNIQPRLLYGLIDMLVKTVIVH